MWPQDLSVIILLRWVIIIRGIISSLPVLMFHSAFPSLRHCQIGYRPDKVTSQLLFPDEQREKLGCSCNRILTVLMCAVCRNRCLDNTEWSYEEKSWENLNVCSSSQRNLGLMKCSFGRFYGLKVSEYFSHWFIVPKGKPFIITYSS